MKFITPDNWKDEDKMIGSGIIGWRKDYDYINFIPTYNKKWRKLMSVIMLLDLVGVVFVLVKCV